jgi:hypothetical protein
MRYDSDIQLGAALTSPEAPSLWPRGLSAAVSAFGVPIRPFGRRTGEALGDRPGGPFDGEPL